MSDLEIIKKYYGEKLSHLCRSLFPTLLEEGILSDILLEHFEPNRYLYQDLVTNNKIEEFSEYIYSSVLEKETRKEDEIIPLTPSELLDNAGYKLYECHTEEDIQTFKKYYEKDEELCTFRGNRLDTCYVFFAVKNNALELKRKNFKNPERQDEYGTSVISIQFSIGKVNVLSIKNRYNHTVANPDSTFSNNLDNIIEGLTESFRYHYNLNFEYNNYDFEIPGYVKASDGKFYKYNYEINNVYYCPNNIIIDNFEVNRDYLEKERYIILDYFILDLKEKTIKLYDNSFKDAFIDTFSNIDKIYVNKKDDGNKEIIIIIPEQEDIVIRINKFNKIISYKNNNLKEIGNNFLRRNDSLNEIEINNVKKIDDGFLSNNNELRYINLPFVKELGHDFLSSNRNLFKIDIPLAESIGDNFLKICVSMKEIRIPKAKKVGKRFLVCNEQLDTIFCPNLEYIDGGFLSSNKKIKELYMPKLLVVKDEFLTLNAIINKVYFPLLEEIGDRFLDYNQEIDSIYLNNVKKIGKSFMRENSKVSCLVLPNVLTIGSNFMQGNYAMRTFKAPKLTSLKGEFLYANKCLKVIDIPLVEEIGSNFLGCNEELECLVLPNVKKIGHSFLYGNQKLSKIDMSNLVEMSFCCFYSNKELKEIYFPKLMIYGEDCFKSNKNISKFNIFKLETTMLMNQTIYDIKKIICKRIIGKITSKLLLEGKRI